MVKNDQPEMVVNLTGAAHFEYCEERGGGRQILTVKNDQSEIVVNLNRNWVGRNISNIVRKGEGAANFVGEKSPI